ncbi:hypothetical protein PUNSTDRAFT_136796 [Punctularia strigosozonata HHB-11173 SS5]|uniref:uncharacterized protein n=1 Tax=Punctularia strigosozonata (strain HHB-11173) TaxID=741275 RepID=UPI0004416713|nr:uncharacterized protein PUNSTDRAFT_136796 [Punctularia strigosozonata HHB-11173 SS5]EIN05999.1 hypothetical protein PUNSTDRAFT_136796 [Punctularia strigosozonata HHB-11173 SS5]
MAAAVVISQTSYSPQTPTGSFSYAMASQALASSSRTPQPAQLDPAAPHPKTFRDRLQKSLRTVGAKTKSKASAPPNLDDFAAASTSDKGKARATPDHDPQKEKERSRLGAAFRRFESKVSFRPAPNDISTPPGAFRSPAHDATNPDDPPGRPSYGSLRGGSISSPALHLSSQAIPSPRSRPSVVASSSSTASVLASPPREPSRRQSARPAPREISGPAPLAPRRAQSITASTASPSPLPKVKSRPAPLYEGETPPVTPTRAPRSPTSPTSPVQRARSPQVDESPTKPHSRQLGTSSRAAASSGHLPLSERPVSPSSPRARSPIDRPKIVTSGRPSLASASTSHLPLSNAPSTPARRTSIEARRPSVEARRPSVEIRRPSIEQTRRASIEIRRTSLDQRTSGGARRPSLEAPRPPFANDSPTHSRSGSPSSPTSYRPYSPYNGLGHSRMNTSTTSLTTASHFEHRELIRQASSLLCREMVRPPAQLRKSGISDREWEEVEVRLRQLARLERIWGKSGAGASQTNLAAGGGFGAAGEDRERRLFAEALRDGYVLCQFMNKLRPGSLTNANAREDGLVRTTNITRFLAACTTYGVPPEDLFNRDDLLETTPESLARVARTIFALFNMTEHATPDRSKFISGGGGKHTPYGTNSSRGTASTPNLALQRATSPPPNGKKQPLPTLDDSAFDSSSSEETARSADAYAREEDRLTPLPVPPRSPLRTRSTASKPIPIPERISVADSNRASVGDSVRMSLAESAWADRQSMASSQATDLTEFSNLSLLQVQRSQSSGQNKFGTIRTVTTDATSFLPSEEHRETTAPSSPTDESRLELRARRFSRERKPSETAVVDLTRVMEETEPSSSSEASKKKDRTRVPGAEHERERERLRAERIRLGKGKWPDDFIDAFGQLRSPMMPASEASGASTPLSSSPRKVSFINNMANRDSSPTPTPMSSSPPRKLAYVGSRANDSSESLSSQLLPRRPTHRARHSVDAPNVLLPKEIVYRESSPDSASSRPGMLRRASTKTGGTRNGVYLPRSSLEQGRTPSQESETRRAEGGVPFPRALSNERSIASGLGSDRSQAGGSALDEHPVPRVRGRFQSDIDSASARRKPRPTSYEDQGAKGRTRFESMVNLGVDSGKASASDMISKDSSDGGAVRQTLVVREDGKPSTSYQLGNCIGRGQYGSVYRALNLNTGQMVAVKRVRLEGMKEDEIKQLMHEVELGRRLDHPSIVKYLGFSRDRDTLNIVLEYAENGSLLQTTKAFGKLNERLVANYVVKILEGLHYLHQSDVVHCDLKAANILTTKTGNVKLSDFGVSLNMRAVKHEYRKDVQGTPNWIAPEVIELKGASSASDIWSLGCTVVELFTGKPPYAELDNSMSVMFRIVDDENPPIPEGCSPELEDFLRLCFQKDPKKRPSAESLCDHEWLKKYWAGHKELRPQDSIPFIRRVSQEIQKSPLSARYLASLDTSGQDASQLDETTPRPLGRRVSTGPTTPLEDSISPREHTFVKTTFSKAMKCRVCLEAVKRSAVLCEQCSLIAHAKCAPHAPPTCDLRSQLLMYAQYAENGDPGSAYATAMEILAAAQAAGPPTSHGSEQSGLPSPRTSLDYQPSQAPSSHGAPVHPPTAFRGWVPFKRSRSSLSPEPKETTSTPSLVGQSPSIPEEKKILQKKRSVLKRPSRPVIEKPQSLSSNSSGPNTSSMRSAVTAAESISGFHLARPESVATVTETDLEPVNPNAGSGSARTNRASHFTTRSAETMESVFDEARTTSIPGGLPPPDTRHHKSRADRSSKASSNGCSIQ